LGDRWLRPHHLQQDVPLDLGLGAVVLLPVPTLTPKSEIEIALSVPIDIGPRGAACKGLRPLSVAAVTETNVCQGRFAPWTMLTPLADRARMAMSRMLKR